MEHDRTLSAVFPIILRQNGGTEQILLYRRINTGYMDGKWDIAAGGHVDRGETATETLARECGEEIGITVRPEDAAFAHLCHSVERSGRQTYYNLYLRVRTYTETPTIMEPEKCAALEWFDLSRLPEDMIPARKRDLLLALAGRMYRESLREE
ncbi:MAG: NUDIX domain-containing protein [Oscillibacter sp.]|nr:NUDIX domain-containing protein [Oscillibacter sp.]